MNKQIANYDKWNKFFDKMGQMFKWDITNMYKGSIVIYSEKQRVEVLKLLIECGIELKDITFNITIK